MIKTFKSRGLTIEPTEKMVDITIDNVKKSIPIKEFWGIAFAMTNDKKMKEMLMPVRQEEMMKFKKVHTVEIKNDMKKGDRLVFTCNIDVPTRVIEGMRNIIEKEVAGSKELLTEILPLQQLTNKV